MTQSVRGIILNYRVGSKTQNSRECIIEFQHINSISEASRLIGRKVSWKSEKSKMIGKIVALHGKKGLIRVRFRKGVPGHAIGTNVELAG